MSQYLIKGREWNRMRRGMKPQKLITHVYEALATKQLDPEDFSLKEMATGLVEDGREWVEAMDPREEWTMEASAVNTTLFSYVTKAAIGQQVLDNFQMEDFVLSKMIPTQTSRIEAELIPGVQGIGDRAEIVAEQEMYPSVTFGEDWQRMPVAYKKGFIIPVTREAVFFDRTGLILKMAAMLGEYLGVQREKEIADTIIDNPRGSATNGMGNRMDWRGTLYATYDAGTNWTNTQSNELVNFSDLAQAEKLFDNMLDPWTGEPIVINGTSILTVPALKQQAMAMAQSSMITEGSDRGTNLPVYQERPNPWKGMGWATSRILYRRIINGGNAGTAVSAADAEKYWYYGDIRGAFAWLEHFPLTVEQIGAGSFLDFTHDIIAAFKTRYKGTAVTNQPRKVTRNTG